VTHDECMYAGEWKKMGCGASANQVHDEKAMSNKPGKRSHKKTTDNWKTQERGDSASSKISRHSGDSGFDDEDELQRQRELAFLG